MSDSFTKGKIFLKNEYKSARYKGLHLVSFGGNNI